ncbi:MAG: alkaline phosphatase family protein [Deltaproteobacteria bacterium]|nr:alkaline phosphatase family protein [Deltaproteobacteria bacterium]
MSRAFSFHSWLFCILLIMGIEAGGEAHAYIGPGAGFAFVGSFLALLSAAALALITFLWWPVRALIQGRRRRKLPGGRRSLRQQKVVVIGLDGLEPTIVEHFMNRGELPHFKNIQRKGGLYRLATSTPPESPVAWACFATGCNPGRHNVFDFLRKQPGTYLPGLSLAEVTPPGRFLTLGSYHIPLSAPRVQQLRKGKPFWSITGEYGVPTVVLRVPGTFPPDRIHGRMLSAMGVPDLRGTQGTFTLYASKPPECNPESGGVVVPVKPYNGVIQTTIAGPKLLARKGNSDASISMTIRPMDGKVEIHTQGQRFGVAPGQFTPWVHLQFPVGPGSRISGICRFYLQSLKPDLRLYMSPVNIDPEKPALPISHPSMYSEYLARVIGRYSTLGMCEDTWALNEGVLDGEAFLKQCYDLLEERRMMLFHELERFRHGVLTCIFDTPDRIQHMFWAEADMPDYGEIFGDLYRRLDHLLGQILGALDDNTLLMVLSDHGFQPFSRMVHLNRWLVHEELMSLSSEDDKSTFFHNVDWDGTSAFALGLAGIYINRAGREPHGIVPPWEVESIRDRIINGLTAWVDPATGLRPIRRIFRREEVYAGPYVETAPDLIVGCERGYRISWQTALGGMGKLSVEDNPKAWSGDHCVDPELVPGALLCNRPLKIARPRIIDIAPTILRQFGIPAPEAMDGTPLL